MVWRLSDCQAEQPDFEPCLRPLTRPLTSACGLPSCLPQDCLQSVRSIVVKLTNGVRVAFERERR